MHVFVSIVQNICKKNTLQLLLRSVYLTHCIRSEVIWRLFLWFSECKSLSVESVNIVLFSLTCSIDVYICFYTAEASKHRAARRFVRYYCVSFVRVLRTLLSFCLSQHTQSFCCVWPYKFLVCFSSCYLKVDQSVSLHTKSMSVKLSLLLKFR